MKKMQIVAATLRDHQNKLRTAEKFHDILTLLQEFATDPHLEHHKEINIYLTTDTGEKINLSFHNDWRAVEGHNLLHYHMKEQGQAPD